MPKIENKEFWLGWVWEICLGPWTMGMRLGDSMLKPKCNHVFGC